MLISISFLVFAIAGNMRGEAYTNVWGEFKAQGMREIEEAQLSCGRQQAI